MILATLLVNRVIPAVRGLQWLLKVEGEVRGRTGHSIPGRGVNYTLVHRWLIPLGHSRSPFMSQSPGTRGRLIVQSLRCGGSHVYDLQVLPAR